MGERREGRNFPEYHSEEKLQELVRQALVRQVELNAALVQSNGFESFDEAYRSTATALLNKPDEPDEPHIVEVPRGG